MSRRTAKRTYPGVGGSKARRALAVFGVLGLLLFSVACGGNGSGNVITPPPQGNFSNASLNGHYAYTLNGQYFGSSVTNGVYREAGTFVADGNGNITSGQDDFGQGSGLSGGSLTGNYSVSNDGTGILTLNFSAGGTINLFLTMVNDSKVYLIEGDGFASGAGTAEKQDTSALTAIPDGTFTFRSHTSSTVSGSVSTVGTLTSTGGAVTGSQDTLRGGILSSLTSTGDFGVPDNNGRGTLTLSDSAGVTTTYVYYVVNSSTLNLLESDGPLGTGRAEHQAGPFSTASFTGGYAFGAAGDTSANFGGLSAAGVLTSDGNGNITAGSFDAAQDGAISSNVAVTGSYTLDSTGRAVLSVTPASGPSIEQIAWMVSPSRAFFLVNSPSVVEDGTLDKQQTSAFGNSTFNSQYSFFMDGFDLNANALVDRVGAMTADGSGNVTMNYTVNNTGILNQPGVLSGTYTVGANGRTSVAVSALSNNIVIYLVSNNAGYLLMEDSGLQVSGAVALQTSP